MFQRFHAMKERREQGFTLIELLVVVLIIAILAAIAVPVFLNQRRKAWVSQVESALKDMATAQESYRTGPADTYTTSIADLQTEGFNYSADEVTPSVTSADKDGYCLQVISDNDTDIIGVYSSNQGAPIVEDDGSTPTADAPCGGGAAATTAAPTT